MKMAALLFFSSFSFSSVSAISLSPSPDISVSDLSTSLLPSLSFLLEWLHLPSVLLSLFGGIFLLLDIFAFYQLLKIYVPSKSSFSFFCSSLFSCPLAWLTRLFRRKLHLLSHYEEDEEHRRGRYPYDDPSCHDRSQSSQPCTPLSSYTPGGEGLHLDHPFSRGSHHHRRAPPLPPPHPHSLDACLDMSTHSSHPFHALEDTGEEEEEIGERGDFYGRSSTYHHHHPSHMSSFYTKKNRQLSFGGHENGYSSRRGVCTVGDHLHGERGGEGGTGGRLHLTGGQTRFAFMTLLSLAILARAISLFVMAWIIEEKKNTPEDFPSSSSSYEEKKKEEMFSFNFHLDSEWILLFLDSAPAVLFFSSLSLIVLFWAKIYYAAILVAYPRLLEKSPRFCSGCLLVFFLLFFFLAVLLHAKKSAIRLIQLFSGLIFAFAAGTFLIYGIKVARKISERSKGSASSSSKGKGSIVRRVLLLSLVCPVLFGIRSISGMNGDTPPASPFFPLHQQHVYHPSSSSSSSLSSSSSSPEGNRSSFPSPAAPSGSRNTMDGSSHREGEIPSSSSSTFSSSPSSPWYSHPLVRAALVSGDTARVTEELSVHPVTCIKIYLLTEGVPSLLILLTFWHRKSRGAGGGVAAPVAASGRRAEGMYRRRNEEEEEEDLYDYPPSHQPYHMSMYMPQGNRGRHEGEGENCSYDSSSEASRKASHSHGIDRAIMMRGMYPSSPPPPVLAPPTYIQQHGQQGGAPSASLLYDPSHRNPKASSLHKNHSNSSLTGTAQDGLLYQPFLPPAYTIPGGAAVGAGGYSSFSYPHNPDLPSPPPYNSHPSCYQRYYPPPPGL